jgi:dTDP-4-amino-4,6-dideoxygalactose transaminase
MQMIPYANLHKEYLECQQDVDQAIARCIRNSSFINGPEVVNFENAWQAYTGAEACAGVSSGTSALMLALLAVGVQPGSEVIVPTMSFISTAEVVSQIGATPVFADIDQYHTLDINQVARLITNKTQAIIFVDLYGQTIDFDQLKQIAGNIPIIQDAAQASGCKYLGTNIGTRAHATCFSFYPGKNLSAMGDAGAVVGPQQTMDRVKILRDHGRKEKYRHEVVGWNERLDGLQAAIVSAKIPYLDKWNQRRQYNAQLYRDLLADCAQINLPQLNPVSSHVYNQFVITTIRRTELRDYLASKQIEAGIQFPLAMHEQPVYAGLGYRLPVAEKLSSSCLSLPIHAQLTDADVKRVAGEILNFFN